MSTTVHENAGFNPEVASRSYTPSQWAQKEDWYVHKVQSITVPIAPNPADIAKVANDIESVLSTARMDMGYIKQNSDRFSMEMKLYEKELYTTLKNDPTINVTGKLTIAEIESHVVKTIKNSTWGGTKLSLYDLVILSSSRNTFMSGVISALCDKKDLLITHNSVIKAESVFSNMGNSHQNQNR